MDTKLYNLENLKNSVDSDADIPVFIQDFISNTLGKDLTELHRSFVQNKKHQTHQMAHKLKFSLDMYGVHSIQRDLKKIEAFCTSSENFAQIGPLIKNIKKHLRQVKDQMIDDYKMVITLID
jgi:HPt (histidine-containing phosphotransfer) domain-containing protein